jgi:hypothetical protein
VSLLIKKYKYIKLAKLFFYKKKIKEVGQPAPANEVGARPPLSFFQITFNSFCSCIDLFYQYNPI